MNPAPSRAPQRQQRGGEMSARYGGGLQFFADAPPAGVEGGAATARTFFPVPGGGGEQQPPERAMRQQHYGGGGSGAAEISLGHGHGHGGKHHFHQFGVEAKDGGGGGDQSGFLTRHNSSPPGFFSSPVMDNGYCTLCSLNYVYLRFAVLIRLFHYYRVWNVPINHRSSFS
ncbi:Os04g0489600 [Oryza sativa Japonica Group]|uniref:Os04g0489600 protein n=1 Tax=Oryza sativa subsp. japonica TaxID=39947 RepID=A0A0P0WBU0_ORYSJ|nr:hypothetical protein EE612_024103 [Oryza sativa]BAS89829.1 Os04g0489600 [Oryza sativa Japonica Group]